MIENSVHKKIKAERKEIYDIMPQGLLGSGTSHDVNLFHTTFLYIEVLFSLSFI